MRELFPIPRSLTGDGVRETLAVLARDIPLEVVETPSGTPVFDWAVPREWNLRGAWIEGPRRRRASSTSPTRRSTSSATARPVDAVVDLDELREHVFTHADDPDLIPYRTSYWEEQWGFCMSRTPARVARAEGDYHVVVDSTLADGSLTSGEVSIRGRDRRGVPAQHLRLPPGARQRQPLRSRAALGARADAGAAAARATPTACSGARGRSDRSAGSPATSRRSTACSTGSSSRASATRARCGTSEAGAATRRSIAPPRTCSRASPGASSRTGSRPAATSGSTARPASTCPSARSRARRTGSSPSTTRRPTTSTLVTAEALGGLVPGRARDHRRGRDERELPQPLAVRRAAAREARPLPERPRRDEPGGSRTSGC